MPDTKLGIGLATGMFFHATAGTNLPTYPGDVVGSNGDGTTTDKFTATAGQTTFTLTESVNEVITITADGTAILKNNYSITGTSLTYSGTSFTGGEKIEIKYYVSAWRNVGDVSADGITLTTDKTTENIRNWANVIKRVIMTEHTETIKSPIQDTTEETLKLIVGADNVNITTATGSHGKFITANLSDGELPPSEAFLWLMKDGNDLMYVGCSEGQVSAVDNVSFAPGAAIVWTPTITAQGDGFIFATEESAS